MSELAFFASVDSSLMTYRIKRLERRDLVTRGASADDARGVNARLTDRGCELVNDIAPWYGDMVRRLFLDDVDETDREIVERVFGRLWERLSRDPRLPDESI